MEKQKKTQDSLIIDFTKQTVLDLSNRIQMPLDSSFYSNELKPELIYILPTSLNVFKSITKKRKMPVLYVIDTTSISLKAENFGVFKNRGYRIRKALEKKLGNDYIVSFLKPNEINIKYKGLPWNMELKLSLPILKIARLEQIDPALLMALIKNDEGFISLHPYSDFEHLSITAKDLKNRLAEFSSMEEALASIYFKVSSHQELPLKWWKQPLARNWVNQIFIDAQIYRDYGFTLE